MAAEPQEHERKRRADERDRAANERDRIANERDRVADERSDVAEERERIALERAQGLRESPGDRDEDAIDRAGADEPLRPLMSARLERIR